MSKSNLLVGGNFRSSVIDMSVVSRLVEAYSRKSNVQATVRDDKIFLIITVPFHQAMRVELAMLDYLPVGFRYELRKMGIIDSLFGYTMHTSLTDGKAMRHTSCVKGKKGDIFIQQGDAHIFQHQLEEAEHVLG